MTAAKLDIAFHAPAHSTTFTAGLKPFAEAVMRDAPGAVEIALHPDGMRGGLLTTQVQLLESGGADAAFVIPGFTPERFPDNFVFGIPGLFRDITEATLTYSRVVNAGGCAATAISMSSARFVPSRSRCMRRRSSPASPISRA